MEKKKQKLIPKHQNPSGTIQPILVTVNKDGKTRVGKDYSIEDNREMLPEGWNKTDQQRHDEQARVGAIAVNRAQEAAAKPMLHLTANGLMFVPGGQFGMAAYGLANLYNKTKDGTFSNMRYNFNNGNYWKVAKDTGATALDIVSVIPIIPNVGNIINKSRILYNNYLDLQSIKAFNKKYGYGVVKPKNTIVFDNKKLDKLFDYTVNRHNTFVRGVDPFETQKYGRLLDMAPEEAARYSLTHIPKVYEGNNAGLLPGENGLYLSNDFGTAAGYANSGSGYIGIVRRPIKYGQTTRRQFLEDNDFVFSRPPGASRPYYTTTDEPNYPWINRNSKNKRFTKHTDSKPANWSSKQSHEVRANAGAEIIKRKGIDNGFRHYIFVGEYGEEPVTLIEMLKSKSSGHKAHIGQAGVGLSRKRKYGGLLIQ